HGPAKTGDILREVREESPSGVLGIVSTVQAERVAHQGCEIGAALFAKNDRNQFGPGGAQGLTHDHVVGANCIARAEHCVGRQREGNVEGAAYRSGGVGGLSGEVISLTVDVEPALEIAIEEMRFGE